MVVYSWTMNKYEKKKIKQIDFYIDPGGPGGHPGVSRTDPGGEKHQNFNFFQKSIFSTLDPFYIYKKIR